MSKTNLEEINRNIYDIKKKDEYDFKIKKRFNTGNNRRNIKTKKRPRLDERIQVKSTRSI